MASLRFKKDGTPFVDFRVGVKRYRPEFLRVSDAQSFFRLAEASPNEALAFWIENASSAGKITAKTSLTDKIESFKKDYCSRRVNSNDMSRTMAMFLDFILMRSGRKDLDVGDVSLEDLCAFQSSLVATGLCNASVNRYFSTIKTFFKRMRKAEYITVNYASLVEGLPVEFSQRVSVWSDGDSRLLVQQLEKESRDLVLIDIARSMEFTPFGPIDFRRLKWRMIDFDHGLVRTFRMKGKGRRDWLVPIVFGYQRILREIKARQSAIGLGRPDDFVYLSNELKPIKTAWVSKSLERARKAAGIESVPYTSRHRAIGLVAAKSGVRMAAKFGGHTSTKTTEKHYLVGGEEDFRERVSEAFGE